MHNACSSVEALEDRRLLTFDIVFDYTYDANGFFNPQGRRDVLEAVASVYESRITDDLTAITPGGIDTWTAIFDDPSSGSRVELNNLTIPADTVVVYVGARPISSGLALGGPGGFRSFATAAFNENLATRGEPGVDPDGDQDTDFAPWGGTITYDSASNWNFSLDPPVAGQNDLFTTTLHELGHVLGFGTAQSFQNLVNESDQFLGEQAMALANGPVALQTDGFHFLSGTTSTLPGTAVLQETVFDPQITVGTRKQVTNLDWAAIDDIGWDITIVAGPVDYGDAPDPTGGESVGNYRTRLLDDGPSHSVIPGLMIGTAVDGDDGENQNATATADDESGDDDEDFAGADVLTLVEGIGASIDVNVTNTTGGPATLYGWIDFNNDGVFSSGTESASVSVPSGSDDVFVTLVFSAPSIGTAGSTFARFRLSTDAAAAAPTGHAADGEVEDHAVRILTQASAYDPLPLFTWNAVPGAFRYELEVDNVTTGENQVILQSDLSTNSFRPAEAMSPGVYRWRYRAHNGTIWLPFSDDAVLSIFEKDGTPFITDPVANSVDSLPTLAWSPVATATRYELWVNEANRPSIIYQPNLSSASFTPNEGLSAGDYTAWVRAFNGNAPIGTWSSPFQFSVDQIAVSVLTDPVGTSHTTAPTFGWLPTFYPGHTLRIDNLSTGTTDVVVAENLSGTAYTLPKGLPPGNYSATIQAITTSESAPVYFQVHDVSGQAELIGPSGTSLNPLPVFRWTAVRNAARYELWVDDLSGGGSPVIHSSSIFDTAFAVTEPLAPGSYRAWVRAFDSGGSVIGGWSSSVDYRIRESTGIPDIWTPNGSTNNAAPLIVWSRVTDAAHYSVSFSYGPTGSTGSLPLTQHNVKSNLLQLDQALEPGDYQVAVTAYDADGSALGSSLKRFVVKATAGTPVIYGPVGNESSTRPVFTWSAVTNATRYILWVNDVGNNVNRFILKNDLTSSVFVPDTTLPAGDYRAWVRAYSGAVPVSGWSSAADFSVVESSGEPVITSPLPVTNSSVPTITWNRIADAATYDVEIAATDSGGAFLIEANTIDTAYRPQQALAPGQYRVKVRSVDGTGTSSAWSSFDLTVVAADSATLFSPLPASSTAAADVFFAWSTVRMAARYELWVNNLTTGQTQVIYQTGLITNSYTPAVALEAGDYRAWVRGILVDNTVTTWSAGVNFTVATSNLRKIENDESPDLIQLTALKPCFPMQVVTQGTDEAGNILWQPDAAGWPEPAPGFSEGRNEPADCFKARRQQEEYVALDEAFGGFSDPSSNVLEELLGDYGSQDATQPRSAVRDTKVSSVL